MARYYFHLWNGSKFEIDDVGVELDFAEHAYLEACEAAREIWSEMARLREDASSYRFFVLDQRGQTVFDVPFSEVLAPSTKASPKASAEQARNRHRKLAVELAREIETARSNIARSKEILSVSRAAGV